jgi:hypothetical protein
VVFMGCSISYYFQCIWIGLGACIKWQNTCPANVRPWVQTLVLQEKKKKKVCEYIWIMKPEFIFSLFVL